MSCLARTAHCQFFGLVLAVLGCILTIATIGVDDWRVWYVDDVSVITSGTAWVGTWRACFYSHAVDAAKFCRRMSIADSFVPPEVAAGQVLCMAAVPLGIAANLVAGYAVRRAYSGIADGGRVRLLFSSAGALYFLTALCLLIPVFWTMNSVLENRTIDFPPEFLFPPAPYKQELGLGITTGIGSSVLLIVSGLLFLSYRQAHKPRIHRAEEAGGDSNLRTAARVSEGTDNPAVRIEEKL